MQRLIVLLGLVLALTVSWGNLSLAATGTDYASGEARAAAGDIRGALQVYQQLAESDPASAEAFARLGGMQLLDQRYADAVRSFQRAITLGEPGTRSFIGMGMAYLHMGQFGPARAAFVEARNRSADTNADVDRIIAWIDARDPPSHTRHP